MEILTKIKNFNKITLFQTVKADGDQELSHL